MALGIKHFNSLLVKHRFPSQRSRFHSKRGEHPWTLFWCSVTVLMKKYQQVVVRFGSCISVKITSFCLLRTKFEMWRRGGINNIFGQKEFLIKSEMQNSGKFCPEWILWQEKKIFSLDNHLDLHKGGNEHEWRGTVVNFGIKISAG